MSPEAGPSSTEAGYGTGSTSSRKRKGSLREGDEDAEGKAAKVVQACSHTIVNCRKQKMKCDIQGEPPCQRCRKSGAQCLFKVRANGIEAGDWHISDLTPIDAASLDAFKTSVLSRLHTIELKLGINQSQSLKSRLTHHGGHPSQPEGFYVPHIEPSAQPRETQTGEDTGVRGDQLPDLGDTLEKLIVLSGDRLNDAWRPSTVEALWMAFAENMPALHFSTQRVFLDRPTPILLAAVLYAASMQHPLAEYAQLAPFYRSSAGKAIAELAIPNEQPGIQMDPTVSKDTEDLHNALGIIITGLMSEGWVTPTGVWIAMAYQIVLSGATRSDEARVSEWRGLYEGLRVIDIEHASLRLMCPLLPLTPPLPSLEPVSSDTTKQAWTHLTTIMHVGLSHFSGRHLPTIMETVLGTKERSNREEVPYTDADARVIKGWAKELDNWLMRYHKPPRNRQRGPSEPNVILLQYQLHKLFVLAIYHPVRGVDLTKTPSSPERKELLSAARAALQLQRMGLGVWSNWDLVIITSAALIVLDSLQDGVADREDRLLIQGHINALRSTHQPAPNLRHFLSARLQVRLESLTTPQMEAVSSSSFGAEYLPIFTADGEARVQSTLNHLQPFLNVPGLVSPQQLTHNPQHQRHHSQLSGQGQQVYHTIDHGSAAYPSISPTQPTHHDPSQKPGPGTEYNTNTAQNQLSYDNSFNFGYDSPGSTLPWLFGDDGNPTSTNGNIMAGGLGGGFGWPPAFQRVMGSLASQDADNDANQGGWKK